MSVATYTRRKLTVPIVARMLGVADRKVLGWIRAGELRAVNLARTPHGRPRYAVDVDDLAAFERARAVIPDGAESTTRRLRRRAAANIKEFF
jgi:hypothetical protein